MYKIRYGIFDVGNVNLSQCDNCTAGKYCKGWGNPSPSDDCDVGHYCPPGQVVPNPNEFICPEGHFCKSGSNEPTRCDSGKYQDEKMKGSCKVCNIVLRHLEVCATEIKCTTEGYGSS